MRALVFAVAGLAGLLPAGQSPAPSASSRDVERPLALTALDFSKLPRQALEARNHEGRTARYEGVALSDILASAGAPQGAALRGPRLGQYLLASAREGLVVPHEKRQARWVRQVEALAVQAAR